MVVENLTGCDFLCSLLRQRWPWTTWAPAWPACWRSTVFLCSFPPAEVTLDALRTRRARLLTEYCIRVFPPSSKGDPGRPRHPPGPPAGGVVYSCVPSLLQLWPWTPWAPAWPAWWRSTVFLCSLPPTEVTLDALSTRLARLLAEYSSMQQRTKQRLARLEQKFNPQSNRCV